MRPNVKNFHAEAWWYANNRNRALRNHPPPGRPLRPLKPSKIYNMKSVL